VVTFWAYLRFYLLLWTLRASWRVLRWLVTAAVLIAAAPVTLVAAIAFVGAWLRGWPPPGCGGRRLVAPDDCRVPCGARLAGPHLARSRAGTCACNNKPMIMT
jgi:hypothetical protein